MARIHGSNSPSAHVAGRGQQLPTIVLSKPAFRKRSATRKRAGAALAAALASMAQSFWGVPDQTRPRAATSPRNGNHKMRQRVNSLLDQLLVGRDKKLPPPVHALHLMLGEVATIKFGGTPEQKVRPFVDAYCRSLGRDDLLLLNERLDVLAGAESLFATMNETNRQDVQAVMAVLKRSVLQELAGRGIGPALSLLAGHLGEHELHGMNVAKAWFWLDERMIAAAQEGLDPLAYLQAGLERLPTARIRVLAAVLASQVPPHARAARALLESAAYLGQFSAPEGMAPLALRSEALTLDSVAEAVLEHVGAYRNSVVGDMAERLDKAARADIRTAEVANAVRRDIRQAIDAIGWVYMNRNAADDRDIDAVLEEQADLAFVEALQKLHRDAAGVCLQRVDTQRLLALFINSQEWNSECGDLAQLLDQACAARRQSLQADVDDTCAHVQAMLHQDRRVAMAGALAALSDSLAAREHFDAYWSGSSDPAGDEAVAAAVRRAATYLRLPGDTGAELGRISLQGLNNSAFGALRQLDGSLPDQGLQIDAAASAGETRARVAPADAGIRIAVQHLANLVRLPAIDPPAFIDAIVALADAQAMRAELRAALRDWSSLDDAAEMRDGAGGTLAGMPPGHWPVSHAHPQAASAPQATPQTRDFVIGLLQAMRSVRDALRARPRDAALRRDTIRLDGTVSVLESLAHNLAGPQAEGRGKRRSGAARAEPAGIATWDAAQTAQAAVHAGIRYDAARGLARPLFGPIHQARFMAALAARMADPAHPHFDALGVPSGGKLGIVRVERNFYRDACQGMLTVSAEAGSDWSRISDEPAMTGEALRPQPPASLAGTLARLVTFDSDAGAGLTRLMAAVTASVDDFAAAVRRLPALAMSLHMPSMYALQHIHFDVAERPHGRYRLDATALIGTSRPDRQARLRFALEVSATGLGVNGLIMEPELRMCASAEHSGGNHGMGPVTR